MTCSTGRYGFRYPPMRNKGLIGTSTVRASKGRRTVPLNGYIRGTEGPGCPTHVISLCRIFSSTWSLLWRSKAGERYYRENWPTYGARCVDLWPRGHVPAFARVLQLGVKLDKLHHPTRNLFGGPLVLDRFLLTITFITKLLLTTKRVLVAYCFRYWKKCISECRMRHGLIAQSSPLPVCS